MNTDTKLLNRILAIQFKKAYQKDYPLCKCVVCIQMCVGSSMCMHVGGNRSMFVFVDHNPHSMWWEGFWKVELASSVSPPSHLAPSVLFLCLVSTRIACSPYTYLAFTRILGMRSPGFTCMGQTPYLLNHLLSPSVSFLKSLFSFYVVSLEISTLGEFLPCWASWVLFQWLYVLFLWFVGCPLMIICFLLSW